MSLRRAQHLGDFAMPVHFRELHEGELAENFRVEAGSLFNEHL
jgi:hypothetical protein